MSKCSGGCRIQAGVIAYAGNFMNAMGMTNGTPYIYHSSTGVMQTTAFRHNDFANVAWVDGHASAEPFNASTKADLTYRLGVLTHADDANNKFYHYEPGGIK